MDIEEFRSRCDERNKRRRRARIFAAIAAAAVIVLIIFGIKSCSGRVVRDGTIVEVDIEQGSTASQIADILKEQKLISSVSGFLKELQKSEYANKLRYGVFEIKRGTDNAGIIEILATGGSIKNSVTVTIPEGFSVERIIERIAQSGLADEKSLIDAVKADYNFSFLDCIPENDGIIYRLQGFLFPATYEFSKDTAARDIISAMLSEFERQLKKEGISEKNLYETITLASLVEREARLDSERATIAGVINNRISAGMRLQIDASVVYAISDGMYDIDRVLYKDLETESPYNTYVYSGLPVGPICNPGIKSIKAAQAPEKHKYLYYRTDTAKNDGSHIFTETFDEHKSAAN